MPTIVAKEQANGSAAAQQSAGIPREFLIDEEAEEAVADLYGSLLALLRRAWRLRLDLQHVRLTLDDEKRRQGEFLKQIVAVKERKCDQFVAVERARGAATGGGSSAAREETDRWVRRLESLQQAFESALQKNGVTRYEPSGRAIPDRDDVKDTEAGTGLPAGTIVRVLKPSYLWNGVVLRPAEVVVAE